ncbi:hypothetical protein [Paraburkholderia sp. SG-MS1]|uniref:hypothetical protein n=1 Tax=Paraburkholderia sp. SG-MS1 TaxID=2023741 RepID=UPI001447AA63|nr:hypothetical protein [Paraburkholderia sp. SG-MS1]
MDTQVLRAVRGLAEKLRSSFPIVQEHQIATVQIDLRKPHHSPIKGLKGKPGPGSHRQGGHASELGAVLFASASALPTGQVGRTLQVNRDNCVVVVNDYTRWDTVWPQVVNWLGVVLPTVLAGRAMTAFTLQFHDVFNWKDDPALLDLREVFAPNCPYLPPNCYDLRTLWHSHHGFMEQVVEPAQGTVLDNVNINVQDVGGSQRQISAMLTHRMGYGNLVWGTGAIPAIEAAAPWLHARNKARLNLLLSDAVKRMIGLNGNQGGVQ